MGKEDQVEVSTSKNVHWFRKYQIFFFIPYFGKSLDPFFLQYIPPLGRALSHSGGQRGQKNILRFPSKIFNTLLVNGHTCEEESSNRGAGETTTTNQRRPHSEVREQNKQKKGQNIECTVISVNMPTPHFYRKYAHPFSEGSFLKILWQEMPG